MFAEQNAGDACYLHGTIRVTSHFLSSKRHCLYVANLQLDQFMLAVHKAGDASFI